MRRVVCSMRDQCSAKGRARKRANRPAQRCYNRSAVKVAECGRSPSVAANSIVGEWLSLVEHLVRDQGVGGSNPLSPTIFCFRDFSSQGTEKRSACPQIPPVFPSRDSPVPSACLLVRPDLARLRIPRRILLQITGNFLYSVAG
jgi:hypothetical protein